MCSKGGGSPPVPNSASTSFQSTTTPAPFATPLYQDFLNRANALSQTPFNPAMQGQVAPLNAEQTAAGSQLFQQGMHLGDFDPAKVQSMESPFIQDVVGATQGWFNNQNAIQGNDLLSQAIRSGNAFGGDRAGVAESVLAGQQQLAQAPVIAGLYQTGYTQALNEYNMLKGMGMQGAQAALGWGGMEQAQQQRELDTAQQNAMMSSAYPFQTLNWYGAALGGVAPLLGAQTVGFNTPPEQSGLATGLGAASAAIGLGNAAFGSATPASPTGQKRGGVVRRVRGGLVPVYVRHNGGIIPGLAYGGMADGGSSDDDDDQQHEPSGPPQQAGDRAPSEDYKPPQVGLPPRERPPAWGSQIGQLKGGSKQTTPSTFPGMGSSSTSAQPSTASTASQWLDVGSKAVSLGSKLLPALALLNRGGGVRRFENGGDTDVLSDEDADPVSPGQRYAADATGRATWFNPRNERGGYTYRDDSGRDWTDTGAMRLREGPHASGLPSTTPGIATPGRGDLGNWYEVNVGGRKGYAQKTDIGPSGVVDLNAPLASRMGFAPENVSGRVYARDLGRTKPPEADGDEGYGGHAPAGLPQNRQGPGYAGGRDDEEQRAGRPGVMPDDEAAPSGGAAGPGGARPTPDAGTGPVGRQIPGLAKPAPTFAQRLAQDPFWQFGTALMAKPGLKRYPLQGVGAAAQVMSAQQTQERNRILDKKPEMYDDGKQLHVINPDGTITPTGLASPTGIAARTKAPFAIETDVPGRFGTTTKKKEYYTGVDESGKGIPFQAPTQAAQQPETPQIAPEEKPAQAPAAPPSAPAPAPAPGQSAPQVRQTEAQPEAQPAAPAAPAPSSGQAGPAAPAGGRTGGAQVPTPQIAQAQPQQQQQATEPTGRETGEAAWSKHIMPAGTATNPNALEATRNPAALEGLSPKEQSEVKAVANYAGDPQKMYPGVKNTDARNALTNKAREYDSSYNPANLPARARALIEYGVNGKAQQNLQSNSMVLEHLGDAMTAVDKLGNSTVPLYNKVTGTWQYHTGDQKYQAALSALRTAGEAASTEAAKTFRGVGSMSQRESQLWGQILLGKEGDIVTASPVSMRAAVKELTGLVAGRLNATAEGYNQIMGPQYYRASESWMTPKARETFQRAAVANPEDNQPFPPSQFGATKRGPAATQTEGGGGGQQQAPTIAPDRRQQAIDWLQLNPNHPDAPAIKQRLGIQ